MYVNPYNALYKLSVDVPTLRPLYLFLHWVQMSQTSPVRCNKDRLHASTGQQLPWPAGHRPKNFKDEKLPCLLNDSHLNTENINPLDAELNPICYLLALLGAHHFLHVSRIRVKSLTLRLLMSYIYIYIYMEHLFLMFLDHTQRRTTVGRTPLDE